MRTKWLIRQPSPQAAARLFCIPYSGCGASMYRKWPHFVGELEICPVQLPGRENRMRETAYETNEALAVDLADALLPYLDRPFGLFGHCGSALAAFATTVQLSALDLPTPTRIFLSSQVAPHEEPFGRLLAMRDDELRDELVRLMIEMGATPVPDLIDLAHEILLTDMGATRRYRLPAPIHLPVPITAIGWTRDVDVSALRIKGWAEYGDTTFELLDGVHYRFLEAPGELMELFRRNLVKPTN
ncbi:thioesterase II family protein [Sphaerimonospora cavernae]|uniref:Thioesterase II family protein n=1 Tax=Sphaerimonospora cavernae TaxID=1740611 RepID=A0ABV6TYY7_9ACTN